MSASDFVDQCYQESVHDAVTGVYKYGMCSFVNSIRYGIDKDAVGRNSSALQIYGVVASLAVSGLTTTLCGDCEDSAYFLGKLHVGIQHMDLRSTDRNQNLTETETRLLHAVQRISKFYISCMPTCSTYAINPAEVRNKQQLSYNTHTTCMLLPTHIAKGCLSSVKTRGITGVSNQKALSVLPLQTAQKSRNMGLSIVLLEGTSLVTQQTDYHQPGSASSGTQAFAKSVSLQIGDLVKTVS